MFSHINQQREAEYTDLNDAEALSRVSEDSGVGETRMPKQRPDRMSEKCTQANTSWPGKRRMWIAILATGFVLMLLALSVWSYPVRLATDHSGKPLNACYCGHNTSEARSLGCTFDVLSPAWLPPHCRNETLTQAFEDSAKHFEDDGRWHYYREQNLTNEFSMEQVASMGDFWQNRTGEAFFFVRWEWHMMHCNFIWQKQMQAAQGRVVLEERYELLTHAEHCGMMFWDRADTFSPVVLDSSLPPGLKVHGQ